LTKRSLTIAGLAALVLGTSACPSRMPIMNPEPRAYQEYAQDRDDCIRKHTFGAGGSAGPCLHCELYVLCMEGLTWRMDPGVPPDSALPCCRGTGTAS